MKMKTAKELFADLGYSVTSDDEYRITYRNKTDKHSITFWYEDLVIEHKPLRAGGKIDIPLLRAINQQCEELEWFDMSADTNDISFDMRYMSDKIQSLIDETSRLDVASVDLKIRVNQLESAVKRLSEKVYENDN